MTTTLTPAGRRAARLIADADPRTPVELASNPDLRPVLLGKVYHWTSTRRVEVGHRALAQIMAMARQLRAIHKRP